MNCLDIVIPHFRFQPVASGRTVSVLQFPHVIPRLWVRATAFTFSVETAHQAWQVGQAMP